MTRLLSVVWYKVLPAHFGGQKGIAEFNHYLSEHHELVCICSRNNKPSGTEPYKVLPILPVSKSQLFRLSAWRKIINTAKQNLSTHVIIEHPYYGLAGIFLKKSLGVKLIIHSHNIESQRFKKLGRWWWPIMSRLEKISHRNADLNLFKTKEDYLFALEHFFLKKDRCMVVPFGITRESIPRHSEKQEARKRIAIKHGLVLMEKIILFNGTLDYMPNARAVEIIVHRIIPTLLKKTNQPFKIIVCGRIVDPAFEYIKALKQEKYVFAGMVEEIADYFFAADLFINPVMDFGGIKVKIMEALSYNLNVVSTTSGAKGIDTRILNDKLTKTEDDDWENFCDQIIRSWNKESDTPAQFFQEYHWKRIARDVADRITGL